MYFLCFYLFGITSLILLQYTLSKQWYLTLSDTSVSREFKIWDTTSGGYASAVYPLFDDFYGKQRKASHVTSEEKDG